MNSNNLDFNTIFEQSTQIEDMLRKLGGMGNGLHQLISNMSEKIPSEIENKLRFVAATRNRALHEGIEHINCDRSDYLSTCSLAYDHLESMLPVLKPDSSIIVDTILDMSLAEILQLIALGSRKINAATELADTNEAPDENSEVRVQLSDITFVEEDEEDKMVVCTLKKLREHSEWLSHEISEAEEGESEYELHELNQKLEFVNRLISEL